MNFRSFIISVIGLILFDQITKAIFSSRDFFVSFVHFHPVKNFGLSFGLNFGNGINALVLILAVIVFLAILKNQTVNLGLAFLIGGAISNIGDRIVLGFVRDFLDVGLGFTFNLADVFILIGLVILVMSPTPKRNDTKIHRLDP